MKITFIKFFLQNLKIHYNKTLQKSIKCPKFLKISYFFLFYSSILEIFDFLDKNLIKLPNNLLYDDFPFYIEYFSIN